MLPGASLPTAKNFPALRPYPVRKPYQRIRIWFGTWMEEGAEMKRWIFALAIVAVAMPSAAYARGGRTMADNGQVVHSRRAGVIMHRAVPPFRGVHVYEGGRRGGYSNAYYGS